MCRESPEAAVRPGPLCHTEPSLAVIRGLRERSPNVPKRVSWMEERQSLRRGSLSSSLARGSRFVSPRNKYVTEAYFWLFFVGKVLVSIYKFAEGAEILFISLRSLCPTSSRPLR